MIPGSNLLRSALRLLGNQTVAHLPWTGRTTSPTGRDVSTYGAGVVYTEGSVQAVPRERYADMGLDYTKKYVTWFVPAVIRGVERDRSPDRFSYNGFLYEVVDVTAWNAQDGWNEVLGVELFPASSGGSEN